MTADVISFGPRRELAQLVATAKECGAIAERIKLGELGLLAAIAPGVTLAQLNYGLQSVGYEAVEREGVYVIQPSAPPGAA